MALKQILSVSCISPTEVFRHIKDFLAGRNGIVDYSERGVGYTVYDSSYASDNEDTPAAGDWVVLASNGEDDSFPVYIKLECANGNLGVRLYLDWDASANTGTNGPAGGNFVNTGSSGSIISIFASLDYVHLITQPSGASNLYWCPFGRVQKAGLPYNGDAVQLTAPSSGGSNDILSCTSIPAGWVVGTKLYCWSSVNLEQVTISAIDPINKTITVSALQTARAAGAWLAEDLCIHLSNNATSASSIQVFPGRSKIAIGASVYYSKGGGGQGQDAKYGDYCLYSIFLSNSDEHRGVMPGVMGTSRTEVQGSAWQDRVTSERYRLYNVSGQFIAVMEE